MSGIDIEAIYRNIFPGAHWAASRISLSDWHKYAASRKSSQALAIDVFGTMMAHGARHGVMNAIGARFGFPTASDWAIRFEWWDPKNLLCETHHQTQVDAVAISEASKSILLFECKFHEIGGDCTQFRENRCDGRHPGLIERGAEAEHGCVLTRKGIRYWSFAPRVFEPSQLASGAACPFAGENYQWMRNLTLRAALEDSGLNAGLVVIYADRGGLPMNDKIKSGEWLRVLPLSAESKQCMTVLTFREVARLAEQAAGVADGHSDLWSDLVKWVDTKIDSPTSA